MAKQTFTTGQVLTAAQMTSLQQTAMLGGAASAKTASYTLVAADAGTAISMSNASATTITVNTALFAAGDTVQITNLGVGVCTITAGTATVNTSASLALAQYESGTLDFTSTSAAIFIKGAAGAAASGGMTLLSTTTLSAVSTTISFTPTDYTDLAIRCTALDSTNNAGLKIRLNSDTGNNYINLLGYKQQNAGTPGFDASFSGGDNLPRSGFVLGGNAKSNFVLTIYNCNDTSNIMYDFSGIAINTSSEYYGLFGTGKYLASAAITSITITNGDTESMTGTVRIYGVK
jgi:hypothetical protein